MANRLHDWWQQWLITADEATTRAKLALGSRSGPMSPSAPLNLSGLEPRILFSATPIDPSSLPGGDAAAMVVDVELESAASETDSIATLAEETPSDQALRELIIIDSVVPDIEQLLDDLSASGRDVEIFVLDADHDGVDQITEILESRSNVDSIHIISHAEDGAVRLGNVWLGESNMAGYAGQIASWQSSLTSDADILLYGCDLAETAGGQTLIESIAALSGADVAASADDTGHADFSADWDLEYATGSIETQIAFSDQLQQDWHGKLSTITVNTFADVVTPDSFTSLREAVLTANSTGDTIFLSAGTYTLSLGSSGEDAAAGGDLDITGNVTIIGAGAGLTTIDADGIDRVFEVIGAGQLTMSDLTVEGGFVTGGGPGDGDGGGINVDNGAGQLTLDRVIISSNFADDGAGILNEGTMTLTDVWIVGNGDQLLTAEGGGIHNKGTAVLNNVTISGNEAIDGAGIHNDSSANSLTLTNVTVSGNTASGIGGGIHNQKTATITNSTIVFNDANNGGGITNNGGVVNLKNTIIALNTGTNPDVESAFNSLGNNLIGDGTGSSGLDDEVDDDQVGDNVLPLDPLIDLNLESNGGFAPTHALLAGSTAINTGTNVAATAVDARGFMSGDGLADIGAYQANGVLHNQIYWTDNTANKIYRSDLDGGSAVELLTSADGINTPTEIVIDSVNGKIYWSEYAGGKIRRANLNGTAIETLYSGLSSTVGLALDIPNNQIYWTENPLLVGIDKIQRADMDGGGPIEDLTIPGLNGPSHLELDLSAGKVYWTDDSNGEIKRADLDGTNDEVLISGLDTPRGIKLDLSNRMMYWTDNPSSGTDKIQRANMDGPPVIEDLFNTGLQDPAGIEIDFANEMMYWTDHGTDKVQRANLNDLVAIDVVTTGLSLPYGIALGPDGGLSPNSVPTVANPIPDQNATEDAVFSFVFASNAFDDADSDPLIYTATLDDSSPLPSWLTFTPGTRTFSGTPLNEDVDVITVRVTADDGNGGSEYDDFVLTISNTNDAPTLADSTPSLTDINENDVNPAGDSVASIVVDGSITDVDGSGVESIAIIEVDNGNGTWQYSTNNGGTWSNVDDGLLATDHALLLDGTLTGPNTQKLRFVPNTGFDGNAELTFRAWDQSTGSAGTYADTTSNGSTTAFSTATDEAAITVNPIAFTVSARETIDNDANGQIDYIRITTTENLDDDFSDLAISVAGYTLDATTPYVTNIGAGGDNDNVFYVMLTESGAPDTAATPTVTVTANTALGEQGGGSDLAVDVSGVAAADKAGAVLISATSPQVAGTTIFQATGHQVDFVFSESLSGLPSEVDLESALTFATGAVDADNLPSIGTGVDPYSFQTTTLSNDTIRVTLNTNNTVNADGLIVGTHSVQVTDGTMLTDLAANVANTLAAATIVGELNDAPTLTATPSNPTYTEEDLPVTLFSGANGDTIEAGQTFVELTLTITNVSDGDDEILGADGFDIELNDGNTGTTTTNSLSYNVSVTGSTATVTLSGGSLSATELESLVNTLDYHNHSDNPGTADRVVTVTSLKDDGGAAGGGNDTASLSISSTITVNGLNDAPTLSSGPFNLTGTDEDTTSTGVQASTILAGLTTGDVDGDTLGLAVTAAIGNGTWQYSTDSTDGTNGTWTNFGPVATNGALLLAGTTWVRYDPDTLNGETASLTFRTWDGDTGTASATGAPSTGDPDGGGGIKAYSNTTAAANLVVSDLNDDPIVDNAIADQPANQGDPFTFQFAANTFDDVDGDSLTYTPGLLPTWLSFDAATRTFSGTPGAADVGAINVRVTANDGNTGSQFDEFVLTVAADATPTDLEGTHTKLGGLSLNEDGGNNAYLIADDGEAIAGGLTALTLEVQFSSTTRPAVSDSATFVSYANGVEANGDDLRFGVRRVSGTQYDLEFAVDGNFVFATSFNAGVLFDGETHRASLTWDNVAGEYTFFVDGAAVDSGSGLAVGHTIAGGGALTIGTDQDSIGGSFEASQVFQGTLHDLRIFNDVRSFGAISGTVNSTLRYDATNMVANWTFNDLSTDGVVTDKVSGNNLTVQSVALGGGFLDSNPELTYAVRETSSNGTFIGKIAGTDAEREATILAADAQLSYSAETGKFYRLVATTETWSDAQTAATSTGLNGVNGQLVTIRSAAEQEIVHTITGGQTIWLGGSDQTIEGEWRWHQGVSESQQFWSGDETGVIAGGRYQNWDPTQPNDPVGDEDFARMIGSGLWEDATSLAAHAYVVEWNADDVLDQTEPLFYTLVDDAGGRFQIHSDSGSIAVANTSLIDYETTTSHSIIVRVTDSAGNTYDESFTIDVREVNEPPVTVAHSYTVSAGFTLTTTAPGVLSGAYDPEGNSFNAVLVTTTTDGALTLNANGSFVYTPNDGFSGTDTFTYDAWDGSAGSTTAVTITVNPLVPLPPPPPPIDPGDDDETDDPPPPPPNDDSEETEESEETNDTNPTSDGPSTQPSTPPAPRPAEVLVSFIPAEDPAVAWMAEGMGIDSATSAEKQGSNENSGKSGSKGSDEFGLRSQINSIYQISTYDTQWQNLDSFRDDLLDGERFQSLIVGAAVGVSIAVTVGQAIWAVKAGYMASTLVTTMPLLRSIDPLPVLEYVDDSGPVDQESLQSIVE